MNHISAILFRVLVITISISGIQNAVAASFTFNDGFENNPADKWTVVSYPSIPEQSSHSGTYYENFGELVKSPYARTGERIAFLSVGYGTTWWSAVGRQIKLPANITTCYLSFYVMPWYNTRNQIRVEVIDPATWNYITYYDVTVDGTSGGYKFVSTAYWNASLKNIYVRIALGGGSFLPGSSYSPAIAIDDMKVYCPF